MPEDQAKRAWIARVLGANLQAGGSAQGEPLLPIWLDAKQEADARLTQLQHTLVGFNDPGLNRIVEFGLHGVTGKSSVGLMVALREADAPGADPAARAKLADAIELYRAFLNDNILVKLIDANPFGASPALKTTLGGALDVLARRVAV